MKLPTFEEMSPAVEWNELARKICKRNEENKITDKQVLDEIDESEEDYDEEETPVQSNESATDEDAEMMPVKPREQPTKKPIAPTKAPKEKSTAKPKTTPSAPPAIVDSNNENNESEADDDYNYNESEENDDDDEDREDESIKAADKPEQKNKNILIDGIEVIKETIRDTHIFGKKWKAHRVCLSHLMSCFRWWR